MNRQRNIVSASAIAFLICGMVAGVFSGARAGEHEHYQHALSDLRMARTIVGTGGFNNQKNNERNAYDSINKAMNEIRRASIAEGKSPDDHQAVDSHLHHKARLQRVMSLLSSAREDLKYNEDDKPGLGWRAAAIRNVQDAMKATQKAIKDLKTDD